MAEQLKPGAFRVWNERSGYAEHGAFYQGMDGALLEHYDFETPSDCTPPGCVVERWTDWHDFENKPAFENDVYVWADEPDRLFVLKNHNPIGWMLKLIGKEHVMTRPPFWMSDSIGKGLLKKIGTVHDSPETLAAAAKAVSQ